MEPEFVFARQTFSAAEVQRRISVQMDGGLSLSIGTIALTDDYGRLLLSGVAPVTLEHAAQKAPVDGSKMLEGLVKLAEAVGGPGTLHITGESYRSIPADDIAAFRAKYPDKKINIIETD